MWAFFFGAIFSAPYVFNWAAGHADVAPTPQVTQDTTVQVENDSGLYKFPLVDFQNPVVLPDTIESSNINLSDLDDIHTSDGAPTALPIEPK